VFSVTRNQMIRIPVVPGEADGLVIAVWYGVPPEPATAVDVFVCGATYDHRYATRRPGRGVLSYAEMTLAAGRAVLAVDRLGTGASSRPPARDVTLRAQARAVHQVITWARQGHTRVNLIGHSLGSAIATLVAGTWPDAPDTLVLTGWYPHAMPSPEALALLETGIKPAACDPVLADLGYDDLEYLTTVDGIRGPAFHLPDADPVAVADDDACRSVVSAVEMKEVQELSVPGPGHPAHRVRCQTLFVLGGRDLLFPANSAAAVIAAEKAWFTSAPLYAVVIPGAPHSMALDPVAAGKSFAAINSRLTNGER